MNKEQNTHLVVKETLNKEQEQNTHLVVKETMNKEQNTQTAKK